MSSRDRVDAAAAHVVVVLKYLSEVRPTVGLADEEGSAGRCARVVAEALYFVRRALDELGFAEWAMSRDQAPETNMAAVRMARGNLVLVVEQIAKLVVTMGEQDERRDAARAVAEATYAAQLALGELAQALPVTPAEARHAA